MSTSASWLVGLLLVASGAHAAETKASAPIRNVLVEAEQKLDNVDLSLTMNVRENKGGAVRRSVRSDADGHQIKVGEYIDLCFSSSTDGFVTLWSRSATGQTTRIYPNKYSHPEGALAAPVEAKKQICPGNQDDAFQFKIGAPAGDAQIFLCWSKAEKDNFEADLLPVIGKTVNSEAKRGELRGLDAPYASTTIEYRVIQP